MFRFVGHIVLLAKKELKQLPWIHRLDIGCDLNTE